MRPPPEAWLLLLLFVMVGCGFGPPTKEGLRQECQVDQASLAYAQTTFTVSMELAGQALLYQYPANRYALLQMPGCRVTPLSDIPGRQGQSTMFIVPGGTRLIAITVPGQPENEWYYARGTDSPPTPLNSRQDTKGGSAILSAPILSTDGGWVAWLRALRDQNGYRYEVVMRRPDDHSEAIHSVKPDIYPLEALEPDTYELLEVDVQAKEFTLARGLRRFSLRRFDGSIREDATIHSGIMFQPTTVRRLDQGHFVWDATRDSGRYSIGWWFTSNWGAHAFEPLRLIQHAAVDPSGRYAVASLETRYGRLLSLRDAISVIRLRDRAEIFRIYLPRFNRSRVAFLTSQYFAYSEGNQVRVLRLPE